MPIITQQQRPKSPLHPSLSCPFSSKLNCCSITNLCCLLFCCYILCSVFFALCLALCSMTSSKFKLAPPLNGFLWFHYPRLPSAILVFKQTKLTISKMTILNFCAYLPLSLDLCLTKGLAFEAAAAYHSGLMTNWPSYCL